MTDYILDRLVLAVGTQYLVDAEIGRGGMAVVYRATDTRLHRRVAIKVLPPELAFNADVRERFLREAQTSAHLAHQNIVPIYTVDEREGLVYFVMGLVEGESLAQRLAREGRLPAPQAQAILMAVADALAYAHARGVVHRDVKPDNIMLDHATGRPMVTDFGIARAAAGDSRLTLTGVAIGTPAYMSPEQAIGERELDGRSDIYSLGVIGYQMLAGETPFKASNTPAMLVKHVSEAPRPLLGLRPDAPHALVNAISRALAKKPDDRWPDAGALRDALSGAAPSPPFIDPHAPASRERLGYTPPAPPQPSMHYPMAPQPALPPMPGAPPAGPRPSWMPPPGPTPPPAPQGGRPAWLPPLGPQAEQSPGMPPMPPMPAMPAYGSRSDWRQWRHAQREWDRERQRRDKALRRLARDGEQTPRTVEQRVSRLRRKAIGSAGTISMLALINGSMGGGPWFLVPTAILSLTLFASAAHLWSDGVPLSRIFSRGRASELEAGERETASAPRSLEDAALRLATPEVLAGPHGETVRRAAADHRAARDILGRLAPSERELIPDVGPTVDALVDRVSALALTLHRLDADVGGASVPALEQRMAALRAEAGPDPTPEQERRIALLHRQRGSIADLTERRGALAAQLESASLALQNLRLDLLKLRSSGLGSAMSDASSSATQEAQALSRDIANAVDAVREANRL
ncbi:MAG: putative serine/threonine protein kinase [Gemmatimonadetes bacterium]|nr:putative serine/threonine protein kinase [Gemmatimonadota bacterium]